MQKKVEPDAGRVGLSWTQLFGLMLTGAVIGVVVFGSALALFDTVRDRMGLHWSGELIKLIVLCLVLASAVTVAGCGLLAMLIGSLAQRAASSVGTGDGTAARVLESGPQWALRDAPPSVAEHTTYQMRDPVRRDRT